MKRKLFFLAALLTAIVMNLHADTANIDLTSGHTTSGQIQVTYNLDANISIVITCPEANISNEGNQGTSFDAYSGVSSLAIKAAEGCKITAATLTFYSSMYTPGYDGVGFLPGSSTSGISNSDEYSYYSGSASEVVWKFTEMELPCILSKASVTYTKPEPACQIGTKKYESIAAAIAEVKAGETIQVIKDIQLDAVINVTSSTPAFTLDLNGHILDGSKLVNQSLLYNASTLSIIDSNPTATHAAPFDTIAGAIMTGGKGWKTVSYSYGGAIYNYNNGTLYMNGVAFVNNTADYGGGVYSYQAASTFKNCRFYGNMGIQYGAALYISGNTCSIDSCVFQENASDCGILLSYKATIHVNGSTFVKDSATWGGAAYLDQSTSTFKNCRFYGNKSTQHGGAIYVGGNTCSIDSCVFQENASYCGILYGNNQATVNVNGSEFVKNTATLGGAAYFYEATSVFKNCSFKENTAEDDGNDNGYGIVYCYMTQGTMDSCIVEDNNAKYGILYAMQASSLTIAHTTINNNSCSSYPGAVGVFGSSLTLNDGTVITNNTSGADYQCAGVYVWNESGYTNTVAMSGKVIIKDNTTNGQPANLCLSGETHCDTVALNGLSAGSEVYVCTMINDTVAPATFATNATEADLQYFVSDDGFAIVRENTNLKTKDNRDYLHFVSLKPNGTVRLNKEGNQNASLTATFEYSKDRKTWTEYTWTAGMFEAIGAEISLNASDTVFFRAKGENGKNVKISTGGRAYFKFAFGTNDSIAAGGNIMSLYDAKCKQDSMTECGFYKLFEYAKKLVYAPKLPATRLATDCYCNMFYDCNALKQAPELKATTLAEYCYSYMFYRCASLTAAPALPATELASNCYDGMFYNCTALTAAPELKATTLEKYCYHTMFMNCAALTQSPELKATTMAEKCYGYMFYGCTSLTAAPVLPATTLANECYSYMFYGCTSLTAAPELKATTLANKCYMSMFGNCTALTTAPELKATTLANYCYMNMFDNCTSLQVDTCSDDEQCKGALLVVPDTTAAPERWNEDMFKGCHGAYANNIQLDSKYCISEWVKPAITGITITDYEGVYDGQKHNPIVKDTIAGDIVDYSTDSATWSADPIAKNVGETVIYVRVQRTDYQDWYGKGKANITAKMLTVEGTTVDAKTYDGSYDAEVTAGTLKGGIGTDDVTVSAMGEFSNKNAGKDKDVSVEYILSGEQADNYTIESATIKGTITPAILTVSGSSVEGKVYDGNTIAVVQAGTLEGVIDPDDVSIDEATGEFADANAGADIEVAVNYTLKGADANNYTVQTETGLMASITKRPITLQSADLEKKYDGKALTAYSKQGGTTVTVVDGSYVEGECLKYTSFIGEQLGVGNSDNSFDVSDSETAIAANYNVIKFYGQLTVIKTDTLITITAASDSKIYDGTALTNDTYTISGELGYGDNLTDVVITGTITEVGSVPNVVTSYKILNKDDQDVTEYYSNIESVSGLLTISDTASTCAEANLRPDGIVVSMGTVTVAYVNGAYTYIQDETGGALIYAESYGLQAGDQVSGITGVSDPTEGGLPRIKPSKTVEQLTVVAGAAPLPKAMDAEPTMNEINQYVRYEDITIENGLVDNVLFPNAISVAMWMNTTPMVLNNIFANAHYLGYDQRFDVIATVGVENGEMQLYPILFAIHEETGVDNVESSMFNVQCSKFLENGVLMIRVNGVMYNASGVRVQ